LIPYTSERKKPINFHKSRKASRCFPCHTTSRPSV
jgi:hypothetical protein